MYGSGFNAAHKLGSRQFSGKGQEMRKAAGHGKKAGHLILVHHDLSYRSYCLHACWEICVFYVSLS